MCLRVCAESVAYRFGPGPGVISFRHPMDNLPSTTRENLALGFRTRLEDAVLVRIDSSTFDDYIELELVSDLPDPAGLHLLQLGRAGLLKMDFPPTDRRDRNKSVELGILGNFHACLRWLPQKRLEEDLYNLAPRATAPFPPSPPHPPSPQHPNLSRD